MLVLSISRFERHQLRDFPCIHHQLSSQTAGAGSGPLAANIDIAGWAGGRAGAEERLHQTENAQQARAT
jgi:hypothetical protein